MPDNIIINRDDYFYKYRSLQNLERFLSIIINRELYGATYSEMNDPMEGYFKYSSEASRNLIDSIIEGKSKTYICSLSRKADIGLMWTHYADENKGCCIELQVNSNSWNRVDVNYSRQIPQITGNDTAASILGVKAMMWEYEEETRFLKSSANSRPMLKIKISRIFIGCKVDRSRYSFLCKLIEKIDPNIEVIRMKKEWLNYGYEE